MPENLTLEEEFIQNQPDHSKYWDLIAAELQTFGGNSFANFLAIIKFRIVFYCNEPSNCISKFLTSYDLELFKGSKDR